MRLTLQRTYLYYHSRAPDQSNGTTRLELDRLLGSVVRRVNTLNATTVPLDTTNFDILSFASDPPGLLFTGYRRVRLTEEATTVQLRTCSRTPGASYENSSIFGE